MMAKTPTPKGEGSEKLGGFRALISLIATPAQLLVFWFVHSLEFVAIVAAVAGSHAHV